MKDFFKKYKLTLIGTIIVIIVFVAYQNFYVANKEDNLLITSDGQIAGSIVGKEVIQLLGELESIKLDTSIFTEPSFNSLYDFGQDIESELRGRPNPFAPIGKDTEPPIGVSEPTDEENDIVRSIRLGQEKEILENTIEESSTDEQIDTEESIEENGEVAI